MNTTSHTLGYLSQGVERMRHDDPVLYKLLEKEHERQMSTLSLVASCGGTDSSVLAAMAASIVNVTAEGYPGNRYHAGCQYVDQVEQLAIDRAKRVFGARYVNVQPHCASFANHTVQQTLLRPGDSLLGLALDHGGHLTHGASVNLSGKLFNALSYGIDDQGYINYGQLRDLALEHKPRLIVCGTTSYTRVIDFERIREIADEAGAYVLADVTHIAGLIAAGLHPSSIDAAHFTTTCTFKQLYGPRGGLIMMGRDADQVSDDGKRSLSERIQSAVFPLMQGSPEPHTIAGKARAMARLLEPAFYDLALRIRSNADALAAALMAHGYELVGNGTDNHIVLFRVPQHINGLIAQKALESCGILVNKNKIPGDQRGAMTASGVRLGTNTCALRGMGDQEMARAASLIDLVLRTCSQAADGSVVLPEATRGEVEAAVREMCQRHPLPYAMNVEELACA